MKPRTFKNPFGIRSYQDIRNVYNHVHDFENLGVVLPPETLHDIKLSARNVYRQPVADPLRLSLRQYWRTFSDDDGETGIDYRILPEDPLHPFTDADIQEFMESSDVYYGRTNSPYDCTGRRFTRFWTHRRTPAGVVLMHYWGIDI